MLENPEHFKGDKGDKGDKGEIENLPLMKMEIMQDINGDGYFKDGDKLIPVPFSQDVEQSGQEVFRQEKPLGEPFKLIIKGSTQRIRGN